MFTLVKSPPLLITFDPVLTEERLPSVAFDITAKWEMPYQNATIVIRECWFALTELKRFEGELTRLSGGQTTELKLNNMSEGSVLQFEKHGDQVKFELAASDSAGLGTVSIKTSVYGQEILDIIENIKNWDKWW
jgi:hypothetical protein